MSRSPLPGHPAHPLPLLAVPLPGLLPGLLLGLLLGVAGCSEGGKPAANAAQARPPMTVTVLAMAPQSLPATIEAVAETEGLREAEVRGRVGGILLQQLYREGEVVQAGQPLFQIDRTTHEIALAAARAQAALAASEVKRLKELLVQKVASRRDYDNAISAQAVAEAALSQAELNLSWTTVTAPIAGVAGRALLAEGSLLSQGDPQLLTSIIQSDPIRVRFALAPSELAALPQGRLEAAAIHGVELLLADGSTYPARGEIDYIAATVTPLLGTRELRARFPNETRQLVPGQFVRVRLLLAERTGLFLVPQSAVLQSDKGRSVMVLGEGNKVTPRPVETAEWHGKEWVITSGLKAGDQVIIDNLIKLRPGMVVAPKGAGEPPAPSASH
ncbi:MAG: efflux RND transporter periplasmic adaptor subunit [Gammaproteobacteria bacterium]|nr:efflux RND transporter periplasmic adaptor subunit [Gammaproteobacteria bacterium]